MLTVEIRAEFMFVLKVSPQCKENGATDARRDNRGGKKASPTNIKSPSIKDQLGSNVAQQVKKGVCLSSIFITLSSDFCMYMHTHANK